MKVNGEDFQTIWLDSTESKIHIIDQTKLPHHFTTKPLHSLDEVINAIKIMEVRGAPLIGVTAAFGIAFAMKNNSSDDSLKDASSRLFQSRPTAVNLQWALNRMNKELIPITSEKRFEAAWSLCQTILDEDIKTNQSIGKHGLDLIENNFDLSKKVHESIINMLEYHSEYEDCNILKLDVGYYDFGNYGIEVIDADSINTL